jgi:hypothetical protein
VTIIKRRKQAENQQSSSLPSDLIVCDHHQLNFGDQWSSIKAQIFVPSLFNSIFYTLKRSVEVFSVVANYIGSFVRVQMKNNKFQDISKSNKKQKSHKNLLPRREKNVYKNVLTAVAGKKETRETENVLETVLEFSW